MATKGGMRRPGGEWIPDGRAKHLRESCDASRQALGQETIDLFQLHVVDPRTPLAILSSRGRAARLLVSEADPGPGDRVRCQARRGVEPIDRRRYVCRSPHDGGTHWRPGSVRSAKASENVLPLRWNDAAFSCSSVHPDV